MSKVATVLSDRISSLVTALGYEFVGCELSRDMSGLLLRIYIDKPTGINVDDCTSVSRQVSAMLDVDDPISSRYSLEVSSPGIHRPLFTLAHYEKFIGSRLKVRLLSPLDGRMNFVGQLKCVEGENIHILVDAVEFILPFASIAKANISAEILLGKLN